MKNSIKIEGVEHEIYYGMAELAEFTDRYGISIRDLLSHEMTVTQLGYLIHLGLVGGGEMSDKKYLKTEKQTLRLIDKTKGLIKKCTGVFSESLISTFDFDEEEEVEEEDTDKKK